MSAKIFDLLHQQIAAGEFEQAEKTAQILTSEASIDPDDYFRNLRHAVNARQARLADILTEGTPVVFDSVANEAQLQKLMEECALLVASCRREKMDEQARVLVGLALGSLEKQPLPNEQRTIAAVARFSEISGRYALRRKDVQWFGKIAGQTLGWASGQDRFGLREIFLPVLDSWMHRITRVYLVDALPAFFEAVYLLYLNDHDKDEFWAAFLLEWRATAAIASQNPVSTMASEWVEQLLLLTIRTENAAYWRPVIQRIGEVAGLAVTKHNIQESLPVFRPLLDVGRVNLADELKFGSGPDPDSVRQRIIRLICDEMLKISDMASRSVLMSVAGDKIEEAFQCWILDPAYESQTVSIQRFCQLLLIYWSMNRKKAARNWTPREQRLSDPLLTEVERRKLTFLL